MKKTPIFPTGHAKPMASYSPAVKVELGGGGALLFVSGHLPLDAQGNVVALGDAGRQAEHVFQTIGEVLAAAGMSFADVVKSQLFLTDIDDYPAVSAVRNRYFDASKPAATLVEVNALARTGCRIEVEVIAAK